MVLYTCRCVHCILTSLRITRSDPRRWTPQSWGGSITHTSFPSWRARWLASQSWRSSEWTFDNSQPTQENYVHNVHTLVASISTHLIPYRGPPWFLLVISHGPIMVLSQSRTHTCWTWCTTGALVVVEARYKDVPHVLPYSLSILEYR
jgi:hypothetical protein